MRRYVTIGLVLCVGFIAGFFLAVRLGADCDPGCAVVGKRTPDCEITFAYRRLLADSPEERISGLRWVSRHGPTGAPLADEVVACMVWAQQSDLVTGGSSVEHLYPYVEAAVVALGEPAAHAIIRHVALNPARTFDGTIFLTGSEPIYWLYPNTAERLLCKLGTSAAHPVALIWNHLATREWATGVLHCIARRAGVGPALDIVEHHLRPGSNPEMIRAALMVSSAVPSESERLLPRLLTLLESSEDKQVLLEVLSVLMEWGSAGVPSLDTLERMRERSEFADADSMRALERTIQVLRSVKRR